MSNDVSNRTGVKTKLVAGPKFHCQSAYEVRGFFSMKL